MKKIILKHLLSPVFLVSCFLTIVLSLSLSFTNSFIEGGSFKENFLAALGLTSMMIFGTVIVTKIIMWIFDTYIPWYDKTFRK